MTPRPAPAFLKETVDAEGRSFEVQVLRFENGSFVSVTEGGARIGSVTASLAAGPRPVTTAVIPEKTEPLFIRLVAEKISSATRGIAIVSVSVRGEIGVGPAREIMGRLAEMTRNV